MSKQAFAGMVLPSLPAFTTTFFFLKLTSTTTFTTCDVASGCMHVVVFSAIVLGTSSSMGPR